MRKYFGTDGIRGLAGRELSPTLAYRAGRALADVLGRENPRPRVLIGRDTRISGSMLEAALVAGLCAGGADAVCLGVLPTPAVAWLTAGEGGADAGVMISASHNPFADNGIKIFGGGGFKLTDAQEADIEAMIDGPEPPAKTGAEMGRTVEFPGSPAALYAAHIIGQAEGLDGLRVLIDCANGAASATAPAIFLALGVMGTFLANRPDGVNINDGCGSTHMDGLAARVREGRYDLGLAFDGDADRCLAVDETGAVIDGDRILGILAAHMQAKGTLRGPLVATVMSNLGLHERARDLGIALRTTQVGDRYVLEEMLSGQSNLGGEQSGHVILLDQGTTGDGQLTAVKLLEALRASGRPASELAGQVALFPQAMANVAVPAAVKGRVSGHPAVRAVADEIERALGGAGRLIIRPSGTEPKVRVMVEGRDAGQVAELAQKAAEAVRQAAREG